MFIYKRYVIARHERGLFIKNRSIVKVLQPGVYHFFDLLGRIDVEIYDLTVPEFRNRYVDVLLAEKPGLVEQHFNVVAPGDYQVGLVYSRGRLIDVLPPGTRRLYWRGPVEIEAQVLDIREDFALPADKIGPLARMRSGDAPAELVNAVYMAEVADNHIGLLIVDGELQGSLQPGLHAYWKYHRRIVVEHLDLRLQFMEVQGQEILTKDKVSLRVNLSAQFQVTDPVKARSELANMNDYVYRELQFALRQAVGTRSLDVLLSDKEALDGLIYAQLHRQAADFGIHVQSVGVKDIILPGDMKDILNQVVAAEKVAQANVIKRREETAATRSLLNTAKLMDDNPTLMRLKELEMLEKVTEKVDRLTVFGGLDGVIKDTVQIKVNA